MQVSRILLIFIHFLSYDFFIDCSFFKRHKVCGVTQYIIVLCEPSRALTLGLKSGASALLYVL